jgi:DNA ligase-1
VLLAEVVATSETVAATRARTAKVAALSALLRRLAPEEVVPAVGFLVGDPRQGRIGVGWSTVSRAVAAAAPEATVTISEVDETLAELAGLAGRGSVERRSAVLSALLRRATAAEQQFLGRVLLGEVRHGALEGVLTDAIASAAEVAPALVRRAAMLVGDVRATAELALTGGAEALAAVQLTVLRPVQPMLASTAESVGDALAAMGEASVEHKLDGARIQVHREGDEVRVFTRNLADVTHRLPEVVEAVRSMPVTSLVLDGESLLLDADARPRAFQETMSRFGADGPRDQVMRPYFFDVLHVDGQDLLDEPLARRQEVLERVVGPWRIEGLVTADPDAAERVLAESLAAGHEGVVVKDLTAPYAAGRRGSAWQKVKPVRTLDLVVLAVEWGHGRRAGWLSNIHLGAYDPDGHFGPAGGFVMVGKTFKGMTDAMLAWQTERFQQLAERTSPGTVWLRPEQVVEIALDGVQGSPRYPGKVALRFARVVRYREDKQPEQADTIDVVRAMLAGAAAATE